MTDLKAHDKVRIIDKFEQASRYNSTTGTVVTLGGYEANDDDVVVRLDGGGFKHLKVHQVVKID